MMFSDRFPDQPTHAFPPRRAGFGRHRPQVAMPDAMIDRELRPGLVPDVTVVLPVRKPARRFLPQSDHATPRRNHIRAALVAPRNGMQRAARQGRSCPQD